MKNGIETKYYSGSKKIKESETSYKNGKKHGKDTYWRGNGTKMYEHTYKNGKLDGPCIDYDKYGNIIEKYSYTNGDLDLSVTYYYETEINHPDIDHYETKAGKRKIQKKQLKDGSYSYNEWYKDGKTKKRKGKYDKDNLMTGLWTEWYFDGRKRSEGEFDKGNGNITFYRSFGKEVPECTGGYVNNLKDGKWNVYWHAKNIHEAFKHADNVVREYDNGVIAYLVKSRNYSKGEKTGKWVEYLHPGVKVSEGYYKNNEKSGLWTYYLMDFIYDEDLDQGIYEEKVESRGNYANGKKHGVWYYEDAPFENYGDRDHTIIGGKTVSSLYDHGKFVKEVPLIDDQDRPF